MKKLMLVDDDKDQVFVIQKAFNDLYSKEYELIPVLSGQECIKLLEKKVIPDLIILDLMMPEMNGWQVFDKIKENPKWKKIPIVILTARSDGFAENAGSLIAKDFIKKPVTIEELKSRIDNILK